MRLSILVWLGQILMSVWVALGENSGLVLGSERCCINYFRWHVFELLFGVSEWMDCLTWRSIDGLSFDSDIPPAVCCSCFLPVTCLVQSAQRLSTWLEMLAR
ncbi:hypothetical protein B0T13DRAFT_179852 [Neurospora crassa]|nr:hypothetical protein B0T13DRAFT_179852 [Neurospora crassa]